jgi:hypothetical protein
MIKKTALIFLIYLFLLTVYIIVCWIKYFRDGGGEMVDGLYAIILFIATIYYSGLTVWTYKLFKSNFVSITSPLVQLTVILIFGVFSSLYLLIKVYA